MRNAQAWARGPMAWWRSAAGGDGSFRWLIGHGTSVTPRSGPEWQPPVSHTCVKPFCHTEEKFGKQWNEFSVTLNTRPGWFRCEWSVRRGRPRQTGWVQGSVCVQLHLPQIFYIRKMHAGFKHFFSLLWVPRRFDFRERWNIMVSYACKANASRTLFGVCGVSCFSWEESLRNSRGTSWLLFEANRDVLLRRAAGNWKKCGMKEVKSIYRFSEIYFKKNCSSWFSPFFREVMKYKWIDYLVLRVW